MDKIACLSNYRAHMLCSFDNLRFSYADLSDLQVTSGITLICVNTCFWTGSMLLVEVSLNRVVFIRSVRAENSCYFCRLSLFSRLLIFPEQTGISVSTWSLPCESVQLSQFAWREDVMADRVIFLFTRGTLQTEGSFRHFREPLVRRHVAWLFMLTHNQDLPAPGWGKNKECPDLPTLRSKFILSHRNPCCNFGTHWYSPCGWISWNFLFRVDLYGL